jgi:hypothetical protein
MLRIVASRDRIFIWMIAGLAGLGVLLAALVLLTLAVARPFLIALAVGAVAFVVTRQLRKWQTADVVELTRVPAVHKSRKVRAGSHRR